MLPCFLCVSLTNSPSIDSELKYNTSNSSDSYTKTPSSGAKASTASWAAGGRADLPLVWIQTLRAFTSSSVKLKRWLFLTIIVKNPNDFYWLFLTIFIDVCWLSITTEQLQGCEDWFERTRRSHNECRKTGEAIGVQQINRTTRGIDYRSTVLSRVHWAGERKK